MSLKETYISHFILACRHSFFFAWNLTLISQWVEFTSLVSQWNAMRMRMRMLFKVASFFFLFLSTVLVSSLVASFYFYLTSTFVHYLSKYCSVSRRKITPALARAEVIDLQSEKKEKRENRLPSQVTIGIRINKKNLHQGFTKQNFGQLKREPAV